MLTSGTLADIEKELAKKKAEVEKLHGYILTLENGLALLQQFAAVPTYDKMKIKLCTYRGHWVPATREHFTYDTKAKDGFFNWCRDCAKRASAAKHKRYMDEGHYDKGDYRKKKREYAEEYRLRKKIQITDCERRTNTAQAA